jgi:hypothetical protein
MYHTIKFRIPGLAELERPGSDRLTKVYIDKGTQVRAQIKPYVVESDRGPIEVADLFSEDGSVLRSVRFASFRFVDD